jgi:hypothetical protein
VKALELAHEPDEWYVGFIRTETRRWWNCFTWNNFNHCFAFGYVRAGWIVVDWCSKGLRVKVMDGEDVDLLIAETCRRGKILAWVPQPFMRPAPRLPICCVSAVKHQLGLRSWALTPHQLFCELRHLGAREMFRETQEAIHGRHG